MTAFAAALADRIRDAARTAGLDPEGEDGLPALLEALAQGGKGLDGGGGPGEVPVVAVLATGTFLAELFRLERMLSTDEAGDGPRPAADRWI